MEAERSDSKYECLLFDMDDTLYPLSSGINIACRRNIEDYMRHELHVDESEVPKMCLDLYKEYGTTMAGLKEIGYEFDNNEFHAYAHGKLPYDLLKPDPVLKSLLLSMPQRRIIFTNSDKAHVARVLGRLGLEDCFDDVICFETLNPTSETATKTGNAEEHHTLKEQKIICKPLIQAFEASILMMNIDPKKTIFFDDSVRNIASAKAVGFHTVIVGRSNLEPGADYALTSLHNIKEAISEIWETGEDYSSELRINSSSSSVETAVLA